MKNESNLEKARLQKKKILEEDADRAYEYINANPGNSLAEIAVGMRWNNSKTQQILKYLTNDNLVSSTEPKRRRYFLVPWFKLIDWKNMEDDESIDLHLDRIEEVRGNAKRYGCKLVLDDPDLLALIERRKHKKAKK